MKNNKAEFPASLQSLHQMVQWVRKQAEHHAFSKRELFHIELATEEAIVNIIHHGYRKKEGKIQIAVVSNGVFAIEIQDEAPAFNPLTNKGLKNSSRIGGIGIPLLHQCMDEVSYQRIEPYNLLTLKKKLCAQTT